MAGFISVPGTANRFNEGQPTVRDYLEVATSGNISFSGDWTIEAWIATTDDDSQFNRILRLPDGGLQTYSLLVRNGDIQLIAGSTVLSGINIADGDFHLISGVYDSDGGVGGTTGSLTLYVDGVEVARNLNTAAPPTSSENLFIGTSNGTASNQFFDGSISEVRLWNTARSEGEIVETSVELDPAAHSDLTFFLGFDGTNATDYKNGANITRNGETHVETVLFARAGETSDLDTQDMFGNDVAINGDPGDDAVYTLSSPDGVIFLTDTTGITLLTENGASEVSFQTGQQLAMMGGIQALAPASNEQIVDNVLANAQFRPNDGFTGQTTVTFSIEGPGVSESVQFAMAVAPSNSIVTTALDVVDATDGLLSLREAVMLVNDGVTTDTITFDPTVFNGELQDVIRLTQGDILIETQMLIDGDLNGDGTPDVVVSGDVFGDDIVDVNGITDVTASLAGSDRLDDNSRVFVSTNTSIYLNGLTITGGRTTGYGSNQGDMYFAGGAVHSRYSHVSISDSVLAGNSTTGYAAGGGAVFAYGGITLRDTLVTGNSTAGDYALGGALLSKWADTKLYNSQVASNSTYGTGADGGGVATYGADIRAVETSIANNFSATAGGGIAANGRVSLTNVTVNGNTAAGFGGGIEAGSYVYLTNTTVSGNTSTGGGGLYTTSNAFVTASTISGNSTTTASGYGGGINALGALYLTDSIVLGNVSRQPGIGADELEALGGEVFYGHNLVGQNTAAFDVSPHVNVDNANPGQVFDATFNNFGVSAGVLGYNGGKLLTIALKQDPSNPAIDAASGSLPGDVFDLDNDGDFGELLPVDARGEGFFRTLSLTNGSTNGGYSGDRDLGAYEAQGAIGLVVNTADDTFDLLDNYVSLREAVAHANNGTFGNYNTITFDPTVFNGQPADVIRLTNGQLDIYTQDLTIDGDLDDDGTPDVVISGDAFGNDITNAQGITQVDASLATTDRLADNSRIFQSSYFGGTLVLEGLTLTGGRFVGNYSGGGGAVQTTGSLTIRDSALLGNSTDGNYADGGAANVYGYLSVENSVVSGNRTHGQNAEGGAVRQYSSGYVTDITGSQFSDNETAGLGSRGGAISSAGNLFIEDSTLSGNSTYADDAAGGAVYGSNYVSIRQSTVSGNSTAGENANGGGIANGGSGSVTIVQSTVSGNATSGGYASGGGVYGGSVSLNSSTVSGNSTAGIQSKGGGVATFGYLQTTNTTVSGNSTAGDYSDGGGIYANGISLRNSTVTGNRTDGASAEGGGVFVSSYGSISDSIILGNTTTYSGLGQDEIYGPVGFYGQNLVGADTAAFDATYFSQVDNAAPSLVFDSVFNNNGVGAGVLADNGGLVETVALRTVPGNPAIDGGTDSLPTDSQDLDKDGNFGEPIPFDARGPGFARDINGFGGNAHDLGAFEAQPTNPSLVVNTPVDVVNAFDNFTSLREAVGFVNAGVLDGTITFAPVIFNGEPGDIIRLQLGEIEVTTSISIDGDLNDDGTPDVTITGDTLGDDNVDANGITETVAGFNSFLSDNTRIFHFTQQNQAESYLTGLTLTGGYTNDNGYSSYDQGGAIRTQSALTIADSVIAGNATGDATARGGAILNTFNAPLTIRNSVIDSNRTLDNSSGAEGGAIFSFGDVSIYSSTLSNNTTQGSGADGGALRGNGDILIVDSMITGNSVNDSGGGDGGAIFSNYSGSLTILNSTLSGNYTHQSGSQGGAVAARGGLLIMNSTFSGNKTFGTSADGGALYFDDTTGANGKIYNSTFTGNATLGGGNGGGIFLDDSGDDIEISNSIILGNYTKYGGSGSHELVSNGAVVYFNGHNVVGQMPYAFNAGGSNVSNGNPFLVFQDLEVNGFWTAGKLADNGGPVETVMLKQDSANPAIDGGNNANLPPDFFDLNNDGSVSDQLPFDARGEVRIVNTSNGGAVDLGAVEVQVDKSLVVDTALDIVDSFDGVTSLREAMEYVNDGELSGTITFDATVFNGEAQDVIRLANGSLNIITSDMIINGDINGDGTPDVVISGDSNADDITDSQGITHISASQYAGLLSDNVAPVFYNVLSNSDAQLQGLIITGGVNSGGGGGIRAVDNITLVDSVVAGNYSGVVGGGVYAHGGVTLINTVIDANASYYAGGGVYVKNPGVTDTLVLNSTISNNTTYGVNASGGGLYVGGEVTVVGSTITGNRTYGTSSSGGGIRATSDLFLTNATIEGNSTFGDFSHGGGANAFNIFATNSTVTGNYTVGFNSYGGGLYATDDLELTNTIVLGNTTIYAGLGEDEIGFDGNSSFDGQNIVGANGSVFNAGAYANVINGNPSLVFQKIEANNGVFGGRLADNGGLVETVALRDIATNPALDAGTLSEFLDPAGLEETLLGGDLNYNGTLTDVIPKIANLPFDARGADFTRLFGTGIDLGAFELETANPVQGTTGNDTLFGGALDDTLNGLAGNDTLHGGPGGDAHNGGGGTNKVSYQYATSGVTADLVAPGNNTGDAAGDSYSSIRDLVGSDYADDLRGSFGDNVIFGGAGDDLLLGRAGVDQLFGQAGDDVLEGGAGADVLNGGAGDNTASYSTAGGVLVVDLFSPDKNTGDAAGDGYVSVTNLIGSMFSDELWGTFGDNMLTGGGGSDFLRGRDGDDTLIGEAGNDRLEGREGADAMFGGAGQDTAYYLSSAAGLTVDLANPLGNTGNAAGDTYDSVENVQGSFQDDIIRGDGQNNVLIGSTGDDQLFGRDGDDTLTGQGGNDVLDGGAGADTLQGGAGFDIASYASALAGVHADLIQTGNNTGDAAGDSYNAIGGLRGSAFDDVLLGTFGQNRLEGGAGKDVLQGRRGGDTYNGGAGDDVFVFQNGFGLEIVEDFDEFSAAEKIDLSMVGNIVDFADLTANHLTQNGADADISASAGTIRLLNVQIANLDAGDFLF